MATISLISTCPTCAASKKINRLMQHLGEDEVFCKEGHKFASAESLEPVLKRGAGDGSTRARKVAATSPATAPQETSVAVADPPPNLEEVESPFEGLEEQAEPVVAEVEEEPAGLAHAAPPAQPEEFVGNATAVVPGSVREIEGKNLELRLVIREEFVSPLTATAEAMGKTMEEYFQEQIDSAFSNGWFWILILALIPLVSHVLG